VARSPLRLPLWNGRGNQGHFRPRGAGSSRTHACRFASWTTRSQAERSWILR
jgi:hypothetical protein